MKNLRTLLLCILTTLLVTSAFGQTPNSMSYQAVIRDSDNKLFVNTQIGIKISILKGSENGAQVYSKIYTPTTNSNGLVSFEIGGDQSFASINWEEGIFFIKTETDPNGGTNYTITGTSQLLTVPYSLHSKTAESITGTINETDPVFNAWNKSTGISISGSQITDLEDYIGDLIESDPIYSLSPAANITSADITKLSNLSGTNTGDQDLSGLATKVQLGDSIALVRNEIPDVSGFISTETDPIFNVWDKSTGIIISKSQINDFGAYLESESDPIYSASPAVNITSSDITKLSNLSGTNTGDQDLSGLATKIQLGDSIALVRNEIPDVSGFISSETDPVYSISPAVNITSADITKLSNLSGTNTGDQDLSGLATKIQIGDSIALVRNEIPDVSGFISSETDPVYSVSPAANITSADITKLSNLSGTNTGDQDLSGLATKIQIGDSIALVRNEIPDVSGFISSETDPVYSISPAANITSTDITKLGNLSGTNTGDQDLSGLATKVQLRDSIVLVRNEIPDVSGFISTESDPVFSASIAADITATDTSHWNNAYKWGNHTTQNYLKNTSETIAGDLMYYDGTNWISKKLTVSTSGGGQEFSIMQPYLVVNYCIAISGIYPSRSGQDPYMGEIQIFGFNYAPVNYVFCDGALMSIAQYSALFSLLGTTYGGNGQSTFALPDLRGRVPIHRNFSPGITIREMGEMGGSESVTLIQNQIPAHTHSIIYE